MFPRNPYARIAGLMPLTLLILGMALTGTERYFYTHRYSPPIVTRFSDDLNLLHAEVATLETKPVSLVVAEAEKPFYQAVADRNKTISTVTPNQPLPNKGQFLVTRSAFSELSLGNNEPVKIITNGRSEASDRLYLYKTIAE